MRSIAGREIFEVGLGSMNLATAADPRAVIEAALDAGMQMIDTADVYAPDAQRVGYVEHIVGEFAGKAMIATKGGVRRDGEAWIHDGRPEHLRRACEASLARLGRIDLYYLHAVDERVPIEESIGELARLSHEGKIGAIGVSNVDRVQIERALREADIAAVQNELSPYVAGDLSVLELCEERSIAFVAHSPMGGWRAGSTAHLAALRSTGDRLGASPFEVVIAWLLSLSPSILVIPGASRPENARASAAAATLRLTIEDWPRGLRRPR
jgi:aryl-alcohol dehydrogenase-like predicted oxidoreductase